MPSVGAHRDTLLVFGAPAIEQYAISEVVASMRSGGWLGTGPKVARFGQEFGSYQGTAYAVAVASSRAAVHGRVIACGFGPGDEVITTP